MDSLVMELGHGWKGSQDSDSHHASMKQISEIKELSFFLSLHRKRVLLPKVSQKNLAEYFFFKLLLINDTPQNKGRNSDFTFYCQKFRKKLAKY